MKGRTRVRMLRGARGAKGEQLAPGKVYELSARMANSFLTHGKAERWDDDAAAMADADVAPELDATDAARDLAEAEGMELAEIVGTGMDGRITKGDVEAAIAARDGDG